MAFNLITIAETHKLIQQQTIATELNEIIKCNNISGIYGLTLTHDQILGLLETRYYALTANDRIEFGSGLIEKLIKAFCDSSFLSMHNYSETLNELIELFYCFKTKYNGLIQDDDLIEDMKKVFEKSNGCIELLSDCNLYERFRGYIISYELDFSEDDNNFDVFGTEDEDYYDYE